MAKRKAKHHAPKKHQDARVEESVLPNKLAISPKDSDSKSTNIIQITEPITIPWLKVSGLSVLISVLLFVALHTDLFSLFKFDDLINRQFVAYAEAYIDKPVSEDIAILTIEEDPQKNGGLGTFGPSWRKYHSQLIDAMARAGVDVIAFDMHFEDASPDNDENFGKAIQSANELGTKVILGVRNYKTVEDKQQPQVVPKLARYLDSSNWGLLDVGGGNRDSRLIRKLKLAKDPSTDSRDWIETQKYPVIPSFALQVVIQFLAGRNQAVALYTKDENQVDVQVLGGQALRSIPVDRNMDFIFVNADKTTLEKISFPYGEVIEHHLLDEEYLRSLFSGKIVLVGVKAHDDLAQVYSNDKRYGVEILASATSNLLQGVYVTPLSDTYKYLLILTMCLCGALLKSRFTNWMKYRIPLKISKFTELKVELPVSLFIVTAVYLVVAFFVYLQMRRMLSIPYDLSALVITFYVTNVLVRRKVVRV